MKNGLSERTVKPQVSTCQAMTIGILLTHPGCHRRVVFGLEMTIESWAKPPSVSPHISPYSTFWGGGCTSGQ